MSDIDFKKLTNVELYKLRDGYHGGSPTSAGAKEELERRRIAHEFWTRNVVAWLALLVSIAALVVSLVKKA